MDLKKYRKSFRHYIPWESELWSSEYDETDDGIIYTKYGKAGFQATLEIRNYDLDYYPEEAVRQVVKRLNNIYKRLPDGFTIHYEVQRRKTKNYITKNLEGKPLVSKILDKIREDKFKNIDFFETKYYITLSYVVLDNTERKVYNFFKNKREESEESYSQVILQNKKEFKNILFSFIESMKKISIEVKILKNTDLMNYLYSTVNSEYRNNVKVPPKGYYLDEYLSNSNFTDGIDFKINNKYFKTITLSVFSDTVVPRIFKQLENLDFEFRYVTRFIILNREEAIKMMEGYREFHKGQSRNKRQWLNEMLTQKETVNINKAALEKSIEADSAMNDLRKGLLSYGLYTFTMIIEDDDLKMLNEKCDEVKGLIEDLGFNAVIEEFNTFDSFVGAIPGNIVMNIRKSPINTAVLTYLLPISSVFSGKNWNKHLNDIPLMTVNTGVSDLFRLNLHVGDVGHTAIFGRTGGGKSVILGNLWSAYMKYENARAVIFDVKASSMVLTHLMGGDFYNLGKNELSFQPLSRVDEYEELVWANDWILNLLELENVEITSEKKEIIWNALNNIAENEPERRTMSIFSMHCQNEEIRQALRPYTKLGAYGQYFDNDKENFRNSRWQAFEMEDIMDNEKICGPLLAYIFRRIQTDLLDGKPLILGIDEYGMLSKNKLIESQMERWLRVIRSKNGLVIFATQSLDEVINSDITSIILDSCKTKIFLPNPSAELNDKKLYEILGLNEKEIETIANAEEKAEYFYLSELGSRLFNMELSNMELIFTASSSKEDIAKITEIKNSTEDVKERIINWIDYKEDTGVINIKEKEYLKEIIGGFYEKNNNDINFFSRD